MVVKLANPQTPNPKPVQVPTAPNGTPAVSPVTVAPSASPAPLELISMAIHMDIVRNVLINPRMHTIVRGGLEALYARISVDLGLIQLRLILIA